MESVFQSTVDEITKNKKINYKKKDKDKNRFFMPSFEC